MELPFLARSNEGGRGEPYVRAGPFPGRRDSTDAAIDAMKRKLQRARRIALVATAALDVAAIIALWPLTASGSPELLVPILSAIGSVLAGSAMLVYFVRRGPRRVLEFAEALRPRATYAELLFGQGLPLMFDNGVWLVYSQGGLLFIAHYAAGGTILMARPEQVKAWRMTFRRARRVGWATHQRPLGALAARLDSVRSALWTSWSRVDLLEARPERIALMGGPTWLASAMFGPLPAFRRISPDIVRTQVDAIRELVDEARTNLQMGPPAPARH